MTARAAFKQADIERALKGVLAAGLTVASVEITSEGISINIGEPQQPSRSKSQKLVDKLYGF